MQVVFEINLLVEVLIIRKIKLVNNQTSLKITNNKYITDVEIYNKLMFALAKTGSTNKIIRLFNKMRSKDSPGGSIKPNLNSYVAALQSIGFNLNNNADLDLNSTRLSAERIIFDIVKSNVIT